jgi:hypothetical protein
VKRTGRFYPGDLISWSWLRQIGLLDAKPPSGTPDALDVLKGHLEQLAKRLGEA